MKQMNEKIYKALNEQIKHEVLLVIYLPVHGLLYRQYPARWLYKWFRNQAREEHEHAMKIYEYILERNLPVDLQAIEKRLLSSNRSKKFLRWLLNMSKK